MEVNHVQPKKVKKSEDLNRDTDRLVDGAQQWTDGMKRVHVVV